MIQLVGFHVGKFIPAADGIQQCRRHPAAGTPQLHMQQMTAADGTFIQRGIQQVSAGYPADLRFGIGFAADTVERAGFPGGKQCRSIFRNRAGNFKNTEGNGTVFKRQDLSP